jgi:hypothetical protein
MEDQGVLRYCPRRCSRNPHVGGGVRLLETPVLEVYVL